jgi:hypothetical protein
MSFSEFWQTPAHALSKCPASGTKSEWKHCQGTVKLPDGSKYTGEFRNGVANGRGRFNSRKYGYYVGEFRNGKFHGQGTLKAPNGWKYFGQFRNGKLNGKATATAPNGRKTIGYWRNGKFVRQTR